MTAETPAERIGVLGLGIMGSSIARNLIAAGRTVSGYDPDAVRSTEAREYGVQVQDSIASVARSAELILTSLPSPEALGDVSQQICDLPSAERSTNLVVELSTLSIDCKESNRDRLARASVTLLDCPISGTGAQTRTGDIVIYASGDEDAYRRIKAVLGDFARDSHYLGDFGAGMKMKFVANLLVAIHNVAAAEAVQLGRRAGLDLEVLREVIGLGGGTSRVFELRSPLMIASEYEPATMKLDVWQKDMDLIEAFASDLDARTPLFSATAPLYEAAIQAGLGNQDTAAVCEVLEKASRP